MNSEFGSENEKKKLLNSGIESASHFLCYVLGFGSVQRSRQELV